MSEPFIDTNVIVGYLAGEDPVKQADAAKLMDRIAEGEFAVIAPSTVIADCVYVLSSRRLYNLQRDHIAEMLLTIVTSSGFRIADRQVMIDALTLYGYSGIKFDDAYIISSMTATGSDTLYSWDRGFDRIPGITRIEP